MNPDFGARRSLLEEVAARGFRLTAQRRALLQTIDETREHLDAATLLKLARERDATVDRATVYRTLELLKRLQLLNVMDLAQARGDKQQYQVRPEQDSVQLACFVCGRIRDFADPTFELIKRQIGVHTGFEIGTIRIQASGQCSECHSRAAELAREIAGEQPR